MANGREQFGEGARSRPEQAWFEMRDVRRRKFEGAAWIPLREQRRPVRVGRYGYDGFLEETVLRASIAVPVAQRTQAEKLDWHDVNVREHRPYADEESHAYTPVDVHREVGGPANGLEGVRLVIDQAGNSEEEGEWHLHPDFVVALALKREQDVWLAIDEGYEPVARLVRDDSGRPALLESRAEFLKDYLAARGMGLYISGYHERIAVCEVASHVAWADSAQEAHGLDRWEGDVAAIHEGGRPFGAQTAVFHVGRTDADPDDDVPVLGPPTDDNTATAKWTTSDDGRKLFRIRGSLWRREGVEPGASSPRVRRDRKPSSVAFIIDASGRRVSADVLARDDDMSGEHRWLWFRPEVVGALVNRRGGSLKWGTRDTGTLRCSPDYWVHFGMNDLGWVTVYAHDVASLPEWQRQIWSGFSAAPDGKVCRELLASQWEGQFVETVAAEALIPSTIAEVNRLTQALFGFVTFRPHSDDEKVLAQTHRFRASDRSGLYALAKDLARLTADAIDAKAIQAKVSPPKNESWRGLKSLEKLLGSFAGEERARSIVGPLVGVYELRLADAHPASSAIDDAMRLAGVDATLPPVLQGRQLLESAAEALRAIASELSRVQAERSAAAKTPLAGGSAGTPAAGARGEGGTSAGGTLPIPAGKPEPGGAVGASG